MLTTTGHLVTAIIILGVVVTATAMLTIAIHVVTQVDNRLNMITK